MEPISYFQAIVLGLLQGVTELFPVSSLGHTVLFPSLFGFVLLGAEAARRRAAVRELAIREGAKADGGRRLDTLEYREAGLIGVAQSAALFAGISRDGVCMGTGLARGLDHSDAARFACPSAAGGRVLHRRLPGQVVQDANPDPLCDLLPRLRPGDGHLQRLNRTASG
jgi:undecaprenyl pyrophosphate phosphatase UppP